MKGSIFANCLIITGIILLPAAVGGNSPPPFSPGEKLIYAVRWEQVPVARVSLEVRPLWQIRGEPVYHFVFRASTFPALRVIYPVDGFIEAFTDLNLARSLRLAKDMQEGRHRRAYSVEFDWDRGVASYIEGGKERRTAPLPEGSLDMLSILYYARSQPLAPGLEMIRPFCSGKKTYRIKAKVVRRETIVVVGRPWPAFLIEPDIRKVGGVFKKSKETRLALWISADERKIPLRVESKVWVGSFIAELIGESPAKAPEPAEPAAGF